MGVLYPKFDGPATEKRLIDQIMQRLSPYRVTCVGKKDPSQYTNNSYGASFAANINEIEDKTDFEKFIKSVARSIILVIDIALAELRAKPGDSLHISRTYPVLVQIHREQFLIGFSIGIIHGT